MLPQHPLARAGLCVLGAAAALVCAHRLVQAAEMGRAAVAPTLPVLSPVESLGFRVSAVAGAVWLVGPGAQVPPGAAPVFQVFADGAVAVHRNATELGGATSVDAMAAILLPTARLTDLNAAARASALELLCCLRAERPLPTAAVQLFGLMAKQDDLAQWLAWAM